MHILVTNDDGPPSGGASPYVLPFVRHLQAAGHVVSVVLPASQRSWIGKAHLIGRTVTPTYYRPPDDPALDSHPPSSAAEHNSTRALPLPPGSRHEEWVLLDTTPASCVQIGLHHLFHAGRGPVDLVVSGPNLGRNCTSVFALSSGTLGAALEAATCRTPAVALSFAFTDRATLREPGRVAACCRHAVGLIERLARDWPSSGGGVSASEGGLGEVQRGWEGDGEWRGGRGTPQLFSINVPLEPDVEARRVVWAPMLLNSWSSGSAFEAVDVDGEDQDPEAREVEIRGEGEAKASGAEGEEGDEAESEGIEHARYKHQHFRWAPRFKDVYESVDRSETGSDGWAVQHGYTSVTPLFANFAQVPGFEGDVKL